MNKILILIAFLMIAVTPLFAQAPPPPPDNPGAGGNGPVGGGAPVGSGLFVLIALGAAYGGKKVWNWASPKSQF